MGEAETPLPTPPGDPAAVEALAGTLRLVAGRSAETLLAREGAASLDLAGSWEGPASEAADAEVRSAASALSEAGSRLAPAAAALDGYAAALTTARRLVASLQEEWQAADRLLASAVASPAAAGADPAAVAALHAAGASRERSRAELLDRHTGAVRALEAAEEHAATAVLALVGEAAGRQRELLLAQLPLTSAAARRAVAADVVADLLDGFGPDPRRWTAAQARHVLATLGESVRDPLVARALLDQMGVEGFEHLVFLAGPAPGDFLWPTSDPAARTEADDSTRTLALAFATSIAETSGGDPVTDAALAEWRSAWVTALLSRPTARLTTQLELLAVAARQPVPVRPGAGYAAGALRVLLARGAPLHGQLEWPPRSTSRTGPVLARPANPFALLLSTLGADPDLASRVLLSPGAQGRTLVHELVARRPFTGPVSQAPVPATEALGRLLTELATSSSGSPAVRDHLGPVLLEALGEAGQRWWQLEGETAISVDRVLDPLRRPAALLLADHPETVWNAVNPRAVAGDDGVAAARTSALLGEIGKDPSALRAALQQVAAFEAGRLDERLAAGDAVTSPPVQAAAMRLGYVIGFSAESAAVALVRAGTQHDAESIEQRAAARTVVTFVNILPLKGAGPVGAVAAALVKPAGDLVVRVVDSTNPVGAAAAAADRAETLRHAGGDLAEKGALTAVELRGGGDEAAATVVALTAASQVQTGIAAVTRAGPAPPRAL